MIFRCSRFKQVPVKQIVHKVRLAAPPYARDHFYKPVIFAGYKPVQIDVALDIHFLLRMHYFI